MYGQQWGQQQPGGQPQQQQQQGGYMQPQQTGYPVQQQQGMPQQQHFMQPQPTGMMGSQMGMMGNRAMQPQSTGMGMGGLGMGLMPQAMGMSFAGGPGMAQQRFGGAPSPGMLGPGGSGMLGAPQQQPQRFLSPGLSMGGLQSQATGYPGSGLQPQMTGYPGGGGGVQAQMTGLPMDPRLQLMSTQFLPAAQPFSGGAPLAQNMNFTTAAMQPSNFQSSIQQLSQQQAGTLEPRIPWALSKEERKSYDAVFRAWDQQATGFVSGDVAREVFGQSGLDSDRLMQIWHLSDSENRGKLNLAEFHVAMGLIYRALNGNDIPNELPPELVPPSAKDLSESVDFLKDLLKRDTNVRNTTGLNIPEAGSNTNTNYTKARSFHENPVALGSGGVPKKDATAYKHEDSSTLGAYKSSSRHLDRRTVRYGGESAQDDLSEMKRQLASTHRMLQEGNKSDDDDDDMRGLEREMEELRFRIRQVQDDIEYHNRRDGAASREARRKAERDLMHLLHERLPLLEKRLEAKDARRREQQLDASRDRDRRNDSYNRGISASHRDSPSSRDSPRYGERHRHRDRYERERHDDRDRERDSRPRSPPPAAPTPSTRSAPAPPPPAPVAAKPAAPAAPTNGPPKGATPEEYQAWIRAQAQARIQERMRALGAVTPSAPSTPDPSVEARLAADKADSEARSAQADAEAKAREEARRLRLEEQRIERDKGAVKAVKAELTAAAEGDAPPPAPVVQAAKEEIDEQTEMLRRREEILRKEKEERLARLSKLEEEAAEAERQEAAFKAKQAAFAKPAVSSLPLPSRKVKGGPPPPPPTRKGAVPLAAAVPPPAVASAARAAPPAPPAAPDAPPAPASTSPNVASGAPGSTNPFHRMQGATTPGAAAAANPWAAAGAASGLPPPQRAAAPTAAPVAPAPPIAPVAPRAPVAHDDDWGDSDKDDDDAHDEADGPGSSTRATRQNLAAALFSGIMPSSGRATPPAAAPVARAPPAASAATAAPPAPPVFGAPAPPAPFVPPAGTPDRGALLGAIQGGLKLRKAVTVDKSGPAVSGKVQGDPSPPVRTYVPPPSPPAGLAAVELPAASANPNRQSVDWANNLAAEQMNGQKASALPDEPSVREEEEDSGDEIEVPEDPTALSVSRGAGSNDFYTPVDGPGTPTEFVAASATGTAVNEDDPTADYDLAQTIRCRTLYAYTGQSDADLSFTENEIVIAHPAKDHGSDWCFGTLLSGAKGTKGLFPKTYVRGIQVAIATALYDYNGASPDEASFTAGQELSVVDQEEVDWWRVEQGDRILIAPAAYLELSG